ncbi:MAG: NUDIX hydrolase, partial [Nostocoides sp.]
TVVVRLAVVCEGQLLVIDRPGRGPDLPFRAVGEASVSVALTGLMADLVGSASVAPRLLGYVRNTVNRPTPDYPWPTPRACFTVYAATVDLFVAQRLSGSWVNHAEGASVLTERHWWPLLAAGLP